MLAFVILAPFTLVTVLGTAIACAVAYSILFKPLIEIFPQKPRAGFSRVTGFFKDITYILPRALKKKATAFAIEHINVLLRAAASVAPPVTAALNQYEEMTRRIVGTLEAMGEQTFRALWVLNHETIPRKITAALVPVRATLTRHTDRLDNIEDLNRRVAVVVGTGLRSLPWGAPGSYVGNFDAWWDSYRHLWTQFFGIAQPRIAELWSERVESLRDRFNELETRVTTIREEALPAIRQRIGRAEERLDGITSDPLAWIIGALGTVAGVAALTVLLRRIAPNLFCRNVTDATGRVCAQDEDLWASLLAGTMIFALALNPREIAAAGTALTGVLGSVIAETVDH